MAITNGITATAADFIIVAERNATPANDSGRVPQLESDGYLSRAFLQDHSVRVKRLTDYQLSTTGKDVGIEWNSEDFDTASMHSIAANSNLYNETTDNAENEALATTNWFSQDFTTGAGDFNVTTIQFNGRHSLDSDNNVEIVIRATRNGADLYTSGTLNFNGTGTAITQLTHVVPDFILSPSTTYYCIVKTISLPGAGSFFMREKATGTGGQKSTDSGVNWTTTGKGYVMTIQTSNSRALVCKAAGKYLLVGNLNSEVTSNRTVKIKVNNTVVASHVVDGASTNAGTSIQTLYSLALEDKVTMTVNSVSTGATDVSATGSSLEMIRLQ